jgi:hypothetical protein
MKSTIYIGTTAINRPDLHSDIFPEWIIWLCGLNDTQYKLKWFINIDIIDKLEATYEETRDNIIKIIGERINLEFLQSADEKGNFLKACKRISESIVNDYSSLTEDEQVNCKVIWLEDDWKLSQIPKLEDLLTFYSTKRSHINLTFIRNNYIWALAPGILSYELWVELQYKAWKDNDTNTDPEHCVGLYYLKNYEEEKNIHNLTIVNKKIDKKYLSLRHMCMKHSYYTYYDIEHMQNNTNRYVKKDEVIDKFKEVNLFVRITPKSCIEMGREYMKKQGLKKKRIKKTTDKEHEFYEHENNNKNEN